ncbi:glycosyltransferase family 4 protein [Brevibacterium album]|uniref:glycosyltransferase family 4 protein n=1 Tax=Brevibacterium album TaxID=417948 RepID=UPI00040EB509|nr:glycosyltransferase family 1 protein [Brevibacterium album]
MGRSSAPARIAIDARILSKSTGTYARMLLKHLQEIDRHNEYTVLLREEDLGKWEPHAPNFSVEAAEYPDFSFAEQWAFWRHLRSRRFDLVHFCMQQQPILYRGAKVTTFHDLTLLRAVDTSKNPLIFRAKQLVARAAFWIALRTATHVITPSRYSAEDAQRYARLPADRFTVTPLAAEIETVAPEVRALPFEEYALYVGNFFDYKNIDRLIQAHQLLRRQGRDIGLVLVGRLDSAGLRLKERSEERGDEAVEFTGFISDAERDWLYGNAAVYVFPSLSEGFGLPGLEAMNYGLPVAAADATCLPEVYQDAAHYFDPRSVPAIAAAVSEVMDSEELSSRLRLNARKLLQQYSWRTTAEITHGVYEKALLTAAEGRRA